MQDQEYSNDEYEQQQQQPNRNVGLAYTSPIDRYGSQISILTDPSDALYQFELNLRCLKEDDNNNLIRIGGKHWKPLLNDEGINKLFTIIRPIINPMTPLSNLDDDEVSILMRQLAYNLTDAFVVHKEKYGLDNVTRRIVCGATLEFCYIFLKRPYMEGDRKFFSKITQEIKSTQEVRNQKGFSLNPFKMFQKQR